MTQPTLKTAFKLIVVVIITFGLSLAIQSALAIYNGPTCAPPGCNVPAPINVGSSTAPTSQTMFDTLNVGNQQIYETGGIGVSGVLTVDNDALRTNLNHNVMIGTTSPISSSKLTIEMGVPLGEGLHIHRMANAAYSYLNIRNELDQPIFQVKEDGNVGIGTGNPGYKLDVNGTIQATGLRIPTGAGLGRVLSSDASGNASWVATSSLGLGGGGGTISGGGTANYIPKWTNATTLGNSAILDNGATVSIGTALSVGNSSGGTAVTALSVQPGGVGIFAAGGNLAGQFLGNGYFSGNLGVGVNPAAYKLDVGGTIQADKLRITGGAAANRVLTSDASGNATWQAASGNIESGTAISTVAASGLQICPRPGVSVRSAVASADFYTAPYTCYNCNAMIQNFNTPIGCFTVRLTRSDTDSGDYKTGIFYWMATY